MAGTLIHSYACLRLILQVSRNIPTELAPLLPGTFRICRLNLNAVDQKWFKYPKVSLKVPKEVMHRFRV